MSQMIQLCVTAREERAEHGSDDTAVCDCKRREQSVGQMIQLCVTAREERAEHGSDDTAVCDCKRGESRAWVR